MPMDFVRMRADAKWIRIIHFRISPFWFECPSTGCPGVCPLQMLSGRRFLCRGRTLGDPSDGCAYSLASRKEGIPFWRWEVADALVRIRTLSCAVRAGLTFVSTKVSKNDLGKGEVVPLP